MSTRYCPRPCPPSQDGRARWEVWDRVKQAPCVTIAAEQAETLAREMAAEMNDNEEASREE